MAHEPGIQAVVADSAYANAGPLLARNALRPGLRIALRVVRGVDLNEVRPELAVARLTSGHLLVIHGDQDSAVPVGHARRLEQAAHPGSAEIWIVPGTGHIQAYAQRPEEYIDRVVAFLDAHLGTAGRFSLLVTA